MTINFEEDVSKPIEVSDDGLDRVAKLAKLQVFLEKDVKDAEDHLKAKKSELRDIQEEALPNLMFELGLKEFKLNDGSKITIKEKVIGNIPKDSKEKAFSWLTDQGNSGLIKKELKLNFAKSEVDLKDVHEQVLNIVHQNDLECSIVENKSIHPQTLNAFVKEQLGLGNALPDGVINSHKINQSQIKL